MYNRLKKLYDTKRLTKEMLASYVTNGILTQEQYNAIVGTKSTKKN